MSQDDVVKEVLHVCGFGELNPVQQEAVDSGLLTRDNLVVAAPTASGKTLIAEISILNHIRAGNKALYIVPLKALASEKYNEFKEKYEKLGLRISMSVGDRDSSEPWLAGSDVIIVTSEKLDSLIRHGAPWIDSVGLVVADEIHLIDSPDRGPTLEVILTRIRQLINPQILALSATINNYQELAGWLDAKAIKSDYRPVKLYNGLFLQGKVNWHPKKPPLHLASDLAPVFEITKDTLKKKKQSLVFVSTRRGAESLAVKLGEIIKPLLTQEERSALIKLSDNISHVLEHRTKQCGKLAHCIQNGAIFHHAGLVAKQRKLIEDNFKSGLIKMICSTPTLAAGINLPAYRVVVRDLKRFTSFRGMDYIPVLEVQQMCIPGEGKILMADGNEIPIKDLKNNDTVLTYNISNKRLEPSRIEKIFKRHTNTFIEAETSNGSKLSATPNHPVYLKTVSQSKWIKMSELKRGMEIASLYSLTEKKDFFSFYLLPTWLKLFVRNKGHFIDMLKDKYHYTDKQIAEKIQTNRKYIYHYRTDKKAMPLTSFIKILKILGKKKNDLADEINEVKTKYGKPIKLPRIIDGDFLWLVGMIITDGNLQKTIDKRTMSTYCKIRIFNKNEKIIKNAKRILYKLGIKPCVYIRNETFYCEFGSTLLAEILNKEFKIPYGKKSRKTDIPDFIFKMDRKKIGSFISGIFDGDGSYSMIKRKKGCSYRILFTSSSRKFAHRLKKLLKEISIEARIVKHKNKRTTIRGEEARFIGYSYFVLFSSIKFIRNFSLFTKPVKCIINTPDYSKYHNIDSYFNKELNDIIFKKIIAVKEKKCKSVNVYNIKVAKNQNFFTSGFLVHNCGRAGRPSFDTEGEAILIANSSIEAKKFWDQYIHGDPEKIISKLGVEPVLRTHVLSLIASQDGMTRETLFDFFSKTFYAFQYKDMTALENVIDNVLEMLTRFKFITTGNPDDNITDDFKTAKSLADESLSELKPTKIGKRVAELYIDPLTANHIVDSIERMEAEKKHETITIYHTISQCLEMRPGLSVRKKDIAGDGTDNDTLNSFMLTHHNKLIGKIPDEWDIDYDDFIRNLKLTWLLDVWSDEAGEDLILEKFGVAPGELRARVDISDWLFYSMQELSILMNKMDSVKHIRKARLRVKYGIREELLLLIKLKNVGRVRARSLFNNGYKKLEDLRKAPLTSIARLVGPAVAKSIKKQLSGPEDEKGKPDQHGLG